MELWVAHTRGRSSRRWVASATLGVALMAMICTIALSGVPIVLVEALFFGLVTVICLIGTVHLFTSISDERVPTTG